MREYSCEYYTVNAPDKCCLFCANCEDVFWDYTNGPYAFSCRLNFDEETSIGSIHFGLMENCENFVEDEA